MDYNFRNHTAKKHFLRAYAKTGIITQACNETDTARQVIYDWLRADPQFAKDMKVAFEISTECLEGEGIRRAYAGSDRLLEKFLDARKPSLYAPHRVVEHRGIAVPGPGPDLRTLTLDELRTMEALLLKAGAVEVECRMLDDDPE